MRWTPLNVPCCMPADIGEAAGGRPVPGPAWGQDAGRAAFSRGTRDVGAGPQRPVAMAWYAFRRPKTGLPTRQASIRRDRSACAGHGRAVAAPQRDPVLRWGWSPLLLRPVSYLIPVPGQTVEDVVRAGAAFVRRVAEASPRR